MRDGDRRLSVWTLCVNCGALCEIGSVLVICMSVQHTYSAHNGNIMGQYKKFDFHLFVGEILWDKIKTKWDEMYGLHRAPTWHYICTKMPSRTKKNVNYAPIFRTLCSHIPPIMLLCCILFYILLIVMYFAHYAPIFRPLCLMSATFWWCLLLWSDFVMMSPTLWWCLRLFDDVSDFLMMSPTFWWCLRLFDDVSDFLMMSPIFLTICSHISHNMLPYFSQYAPIFLTICSHISLILL